MEIAKAAVPTHKLKGGSESEITESGDMFLGYLGGLNSFLGPQSIWEDIVFGAIAAILAFIAMFQVKE